MFTLGLLLSTVRIVEMRIGGYTYFMIKNAVIDKLAFIYLKGHKILMTRSRGNDTFYIPGGKREEGESDIEALMREIQEELTVQLKPETITHYGTFEAQAHGKPRGTIVRMTCYTAKFDGEFAPNHEIAELGYYSYDQRDLVGPVDQLIFDDLQQKGFLK